MKSAKFEIVELADCPQFIEIASVWGYAEWGCLKPDSKFEHFFEGVTLSASKKDLPKAWIAIIDGLPAGMVTLKQTEHPDRIDLSPWLGGAICAPRFRGKAIAKALCEKVEKEAFNYGFKVCHLQTPIPEFYKALGWNEIGRVRGMFGQYPDDEILMQKNL